MGPDVKKKSQCSLMGRGYLYTQVMRKYPYCVKYVYYGIVAREIAGNKRLITIYCNIRVEMPPKRRKHHAQ
jgi:hypothetical protein